MDKADLDSPGRKVKWVGEILSTPKTSPIEFVKMAVPSSVCPKLIEQLKLVK